MKLLILQQLSITRLWVSERAIRWQFAHPKTLELDSV